jgi:hypothetical protein
MLVIHVDDNGITRASLANLAGVKAGRIGGHEYIATGIAAAAEERLIEGTVRALVLDLGLDAGWDNRNMLRMLRRLILAPARPDPQEGRTPTAHRLALLARDHEVPCALLTNWLDYFQEGDELTMEALRGAFYAEAVFRKDECGISACAVWLRDHVGCAASHAPKAG